MLHLNFASFILFFLCIGNSLIAQPSRLTDLNPGTEHSFQPGAPGTPIEIIVSGNSLFFIADDGIHGFELWTSDGTPAGTKLVKDIKPGSGSSNLGDLTAFNGKLYFSSTDGISGEELWVSDGTETGTYMLKDLRSGASSSYPRYLTVMGNSLYCAADKSFNTAALWKSDGTEAGTIELNPGLFNLTAPRQLTAMGDRLYFAGPDGELWATDGADTGAIRIKEIAPGNTQPFIDQMTNIDGKLYFLAEDESLNDEPWVSDGTEAGTMKLKEIAAGTEGSAARKFFPFKNHVYFSADNKLWRSDGTPDGTVLFKDITVFQASNDPAYFISDANYLYFPADDGYNGVELWRSDGTPNGTVMVKNIGTNFFSSAPQSFAFGPDGLLYFQASHSDLGAELWRSDGTAVGTIMVADLRPGPGHSEPQSPTLLNGALYFVADDGTHGRELWKLDLTTGVKDPEKRENLFTLSPNPADDAVTLSLSLPLSYSVSPTLRLYDFSGQLLHTEQHAAPPPTGVTLFLSHLPAGLYLLEITSGPYIQTEKLIKF